MKLENENTNILFFFVFVFLTSFCLSEGKDSKKNGITKMGQT